MITPEEQFKYIRVTYQVYQDLHDREPDEKGKRENFYQMVTGRTEDQVYQIKAESSECSQKVGYELNKYGMDNEINRKKYQFLLGTRKITSFEELRRILKDNDDKRSFGIE